jgi:hypothetical protein
MERFSREVVGDGGVAELDGDISSIEGCPLTTIYSILDLAKIYMYS